MTVFPCPGVNAWSAPRPAAVRSAARTTAGVRLVTRKIAGMSEATPPGTAPTGAGVALLAADGAGDAAGGATTVSGSASVKTAAGSAGPPGPVVNSTDVSRSGVVSSALGYARSRSDAVVVRSVPAAGVAVTPSASTTISRHPRRFGSTTSSRLTFAVALVIGAASSQTTRMVDSPAAPA